VKFSLFGASTFELRRCLVLGNPVELTAGTEKASALAAGPPVPAALAAKVLRSSPTADRRRWHDRHRHPAKPRHVEILADGGRSALAGHKLIKGADSVKL
jgi:hypothetical protein